MPETMLPNILPGTLNGTCIVELGRFGGSDTILNGLRQIRSEMVTSDQSVTNITFGPFGGLWLARTDDT
jgi:hypothetical protein